MELITMVMELSVLMDVQCMAVVELMMNALCHGQIGFGPSYSVFASYSVDVVVNLSANAPQEVPPQL